MASSLIFSHEIGDLRRIQQGFHDAVYGIFIYEISAEDINHLMAKARLRGAADNVCCSLVVSENSNARN